MKKILALALSAAMLLSTAASAMTRTEFINASGLGDQLVPVELPVNVDADIEVRENAQGNFVDGPINVWKAASDRWPSFDFRADLDMSSVRNAFTYYYEKALRVVDAASMNDLMNTPVTGQFEVKVTYPKQLSIPAAMTANNQQGTGFGEVIGGVDRVGLTCFEEVSRTEANLGTNMKTLTIVIKVVDGLTCEDLYTNLDTQLPDLYLQCDGVLTQAYGTYTVSGEVTGYTHIGEVTEPISTVRYNAVQAGEETNANLNATVAVSKRTTTTGTTSPSQPVVTYGVTVTFDIGGDVTLVPPISKAEAFTLVPATDAVAPARDGYAFDQWYYDKAFTQPVGASAEITKNTILYGRYVRTYIPEVFDSGDHNLYIMGYPDGTVQPNGNITREEVAKALYRLLKKDYRESITVESNSFSDVEPWRWSNVSISSMANAGYVQGYEDGTFRPGNAITRAEFATIILRFFENMEAETVGTPYVDISGHWAENNIVDAYKKYLVQGYEDGTFRPDNYITRAEAMTIINRITVRHTDANGLIAGYRDWPDIAPTDWYYYEILEATNAHAFERRADGYLENWTALLENEFLIEDK